MAVAIDTDIQTGSTALIRQERTGAVLRLTLASPESRNALSREMIKTLTKALNQAADDPALNVIVIGHEGTVFCAGHDLKEMTAAREAEDKGLGFYTSVMGECAQLMRTIVNHPLPVIAEVNGVATAAGCQLVASCDLAYATTRSRFATPGVNIGLFCSTPMVALSRNVSNKHAMEMLLTGEFVSAPRAAETGLINEALEDDQLEAKVQQVASLIASKARSTLKTGKQAFYKQREMALAEAYEYAAAVMVDNMLRGDAKEGITAFVEKRPPDWSKADEQI